MEIRNSLFVMFGLATMSACLGEDSSDVDDDRLAGAVSEIAIGGHLPGISSAAFAAAKDLFAAVETNADGIGPIFNARGCGVCHSNTVFPIPRLTPPGTGNPL
jgi:CxxC motif-containing protein (DUF1111 family)